MIKIISCVHEKTTGLIVHYQHQFWKIASYNVNFSPYIHLQALKSKSSRLCNHILVNRHVFSTLLTGSAFLDASKWCFSARVGACILKMNLRQ